MKLTCYDYYLNFSFLNITGFQLQLWRELSCLLVLSLFLGLDLFSFRFASVYLLICLVD